MHRLLGAVRRCNSALSPTVRCAPSAAAALNAVLSRASFHSAAVVSSAQPEAAVEPREALQYDVAIIGAGPAGLAAAIRLKQLCATAEKDISVCVVEKGAQVGAHILSGNVLETRALDELLPDWQEGEAPPRTLAVRERFYLLTERWALRLPTPPQMKNKKKKNQIISLSEMTRWMAGKAEELNVDIFPGFAASSVLYGRQGEVAGVATGDVGIAKDGTRKDTFARGTELRAKLTLFGEGCRGSLSEEVMKKFRLREKAGAQEQTYGLGLKEVWRVEPGKHQAGTVVHTVGYPLDSSTYGGSFLYHMHDNMVALGLVVGLDYSNPYLSPYQEFQRWKEHPHIRKLLEGGKCLQYGARSLNEGGIQSVPELSFPGGALIGCSAGFLNVPKIKGTHTAMKSGMLAAEAAFKALTADDAAASAAAGPADMSTYESELKESWIWEELQEVRNIRPGFAKLGFYGGMLHAAVDTFLLRGGAPWTFRHSRADHETLKPASSSSPISYPQPDGEVSFDLATSLFRSGTNHEHDQPPHLQLLNPGIPRVVNKPIYDGPEARYCPAGVYEYVPDEHGEAALQLNAQNCLHCKACDIKDPTQNIKWAVPEGGGGPAYDVM